MKSDHEPKEQVTAPRPVEADEGLERLRTFSRTKYAIGGQLRVLRDSLNALGRESGVRLCRDLTSRLAEDRFILAVLGQFKRGKSTLMNSIIGREILPTGVLPLTSAVTVLRYGPEERLFVRKDGGLFPEDLPVSRLPEYVTEEGNPSNTKKILSACLEVPVPFLRRGIEFVDTPGVGSSIAANTATAYRFLPQCDAALFVTSVDHPITSEELDYLAEIRRHLDKIFYVVNKIDLLEGSRREEILHFTSETIGRSFPGAEVKLIPVSARLALAARFSGDTDMYEQSGVKELEETLASFLVEEKARSFLASVAMKAVNIFAGEEAMGAFGEANLQTRIRDLRKGSGAAPERHDPRAAVKAAKRACSKLESLRISLLEGRLDESGGQEPLLVEEAGTQPFEPDDSDRPSDDLEDVDAAMCLGTRGCPICRSLEDSVFDFFAQWQYRLATDEETQAAHAEELGFCPIHTWQLLAMSSPCGASVGHARLVETVADRLREMGRNVIDGSQAGGLVRDSGNCRVCGFLRRSELERISRLVPLIHDPASRSLYDRSRGVCLRHLGMLLDSCTAPEEREFLIAHAVRRFEEDSEDMQSFAIKHEGLRRGLQNRDEKDAYRRALARIAGGRSLCIPWREVD